MQSRQYRPSYQRSNSSKRIKKPWIILGFLCAGFVLSNLLTWLIFQGRTYPGTTVAGVSIGSISFGDLTDKVNTLAILPEDFTLRHDDKTVTVRGTELGLHLQAERTVANAKKHRSWLPILNLFGHPSLPAPVSFTSETLNAKAAELAKTFQAAPIEPKLELTDGTVRIVPGEDGYQLQTEHLEQALTAALDTGTSVITAPTSTTARTTQAAELSDEQQALEAQLNTAVTYRYQSISKQPSKSDRASWYLPAGASYELSAGKIAEYLAAIGKELKINVKDRAGVAERTAAAIRTAKPLSVTLEAITAAKTYRYCTAVRGVDAGELPALRTKLAATYADARGWSLDGLIEFVPAAADCTFTVWLAAATQMPTFGAICDAMWSCRVGSNVVLNFDRWQGASPAWNAYGGSLEDYRHMVINHETGHWLGFGHDHCPSPGQAAPVMQQQSIDLQGCAFNPWPTAGERQTLRSRLGI